MGKCLAEGARGLLRGIGGGGNEPISKIPVGALSEKEE
jgi:hypothetical protein